MVVRLAGRAPFDGPGGVLVGADEGGVDRGDPVVITCR